MFHVCRSRTGPSARCELTRAERLTSGERTDCVARQSQSHGSYKVELFNQGRVQTTQCPLPCYTVCPFLATLSFPCYTVLLHSLSFRARVSSHRAFGPVRERQTWNMSKCPLSEH
eukprot:sb/3476809/